MQLNKRGDKRGLHMRDPEVRARWLASRRKYLGDYRGPVERKLYKAYVEQKDNAKRRQIEFLLTFEQWLGIWEASGHLCERGCKRSQYVMARRGDEGPYAVGNVKIITNGDNLDQKTPQAELVRRAKIRAFQTGRPKVRVRCDK